jgi:hypothetical protein
LQARKDSLERPRINGTTGLLYMDCFQSVSLSSVVQGTSLMKIEDAFRGRQLWTKQLKVHLSIIRQILSWEQGTGGPHIGVTMSLPGNQRTGDLRSAITDVLCQEKQCQAMAQPIGNRSTPSGQKAFQASDRICRVSISRISLTYKCCRQLARERKDCCGALAPKA